jgi:hypothetical protein
MSDMPEPELDIMKTILFLDPSAAKIHTYKTESGKEVVFTEWAHPDKGAGDDPALYGIEGARTVAIYDSSEVPHVWTKCRGQNEELLHCDFASMLWARSREDRLESLMTAFRDVLLEVDRRKEVLEEFAKHKICALCLKCVERCDCTKSDLADKGICVRCRQSPDGCTCDELNDAEDEDSTQNHAADDAADEDAAQDHADAQ